MVLIAVGQICSTNSPEDNLDQCIRVLKKAAEGGAKLLFLPEASDYIASSREESLSLAQSSSCSVFVEGLCVAAREHGVGVSVGIHVPATPSDKPPRLFNRLIYITPKGIVDKAATYDKLHLFDRGDLQESRTVAVGEGGLTSPFPTPAGRVGPLICFDLRFAEAALALGQPQGHQAEHGEGKGEGEGVASKDQSIACWKPAQIIVYPSAFTIPTGEAHWEVLLRARAIETQTYVVAAAQVGQHMPSGKRVSYGHSMIIDPWGLILAHLPGVVRTGPEVWEADIGAAGIVGFAEIDLDLWESMRSDWPLRRTAGLYKKSQPVQ